MGKRPIVLSIAGTDPSGGAGIQADIKTISAFGCYAATVVTALVAQNTQGVVAIHDVAVDFIDEQIKVVFDDLDVSAVKIGMMPSADVMKIVANALQRYTPTHVVLDPGMIAQSGDPLININDIDALKASLFSSVSLITPNIHEIELLLNLKITSTIEMELAAKQLGSAYQVNVLLKGGHMYHAHSSDLLYEYATGALSWFSAERIITKHTHGTGCTLSSAIASLLAKGNSTAEAISKAKHYIQQAIIDGQILNIGKGCGPVDHMYFLRSYADDC